MDDSRDMMVAAMLAYAIADTVGARIHGDKSDPKDLAERSASFAKFLAEKAATTCGVVYKKQTD